MNPHSHQYIGNRGPQIPQQQQQQQIMRGGGGGGGHAGYYPQQAPAPRGQMPPPVQTRGPPVHGGSVAPPTLPGRNILFVSRQCDSCRFVVDKIKRIRDLQKDFNLIDVNYFRDRLPPFIKTVPSIIPIDRPGHPEEKTLSKLDDILKWLDDYTIKFIEEQRRYAEANKTAQLTVDDYELGTLDDPFGSSCSFIVPGSKGNVVIPSDQDIQMRGEGTSQYTFVDLQSEREGPRPIEEIAATQSGMRPPPQMLNPHVGGGIPAVGPAAMYGQGGGQQHIILNGGGAGPGGFTGGQMVPGGNMGGRRRDTEGQIEAAGRDRMAALIAAREQQVANIYPRPPAPQHTGGSTMRSQQYFR